MGKKLGRVASVVPAAGILAGKGPFAKALGLEKKQGEYFVPDQDAQNRLQSFIQTQDDRVDPTKGMDLATQYIQNNALTRDLFGQGGLQSQLANEQRDLSSRGFQLNQEDREAFGQASGDIARLFGQEEQNIAQSLARRGLGAAGSGAAGAAFSGLQGNRNERLAATQRDIAQRRMDSTRQRLMDTRNMMSQLGAQGRGMTESQFDTAVRARQNRLNELQSGVDAQMGLNTQKMASLEDKRANKGKSLLEGVGQGLFSSAQQVGAAPGRFVSTKAGSMAGGVQGGQGGSGEYIPSPVMGSSGRR